MSRVEFPDGFHWGCATASYQIEGSPAADGKSESIWDRFAHAPGRTKRGQTADRACDSYRRFPEDVALLREIGCTSYRFSLAWPRIQPEGRGSANPAALDTYGALIDALLAAGIRPLPTLYHWDLPQTLEEAGGWPERDTAGRFADYADLAMRAFGDRVQDWTIFNEPGVFTTLGYGIGVHAPGRSDLAAFWRATHVVNLAQADAHRAMKATRSDARIGSAVNLSPCEPEQKDARTEAEAAANEAAAERYSAFQNHWFLDPAYFGRYPALFSEEESVRRLGIQPGDLERAHLPFDWIGVNLYHRTRVVAADGGPLGIDAFSTGHGDEGPRSDFGWEIWPAAMRQALVDTSRRYAREGVPPVLEVTENGASFADGPGDDGRVRDGRRIEFFRGYLAACAEAIEEGVDLRAFHAWSLLDNFEWTEGFDQRFGLVFVDFETGERTLKDSAHWYAQVAAENGFDPEETSEPREARRS